MADGPTVFVTSATGSQGSSLCYELRKLGWNVRAITRDPRSSSAQALSAAGVHLTTGSWDDEAALRDGLEGCDKLFLCLFPNLEDFEIIPRQAALITRLAKAAGVRQAVASTTLGCFMLEEGFVPPVTLSPLFEAHLHCKKRMEQTVIDGFEQWTVVRPGLFMANFIEPKIRTGYTEPKKGTWTTALTTESLLGLVDHVDIGRLAAAAFKDPATFHGRKLGIVSEDLRVQDAMDQLAEAISDGRTIKAVYMTEEEVARAQALAKAGGSGLVIASEPSLRYTSGYTNLDELQRLLHGLTTFKQFLVREKDAVAKTYLN
ncbi:NmrA family protein [Hypoxylon sp. FL1857]|nr:NmrA family protein [Hypoxylon sp. FL1857]